jgi:sulfide:quinone oxidoreductase
VRRGADPVSKVPDSPSIPLSRPLRFGPPPKVVIAGGGFAAVEAMLALRALAEDRIDVELVAPRAELVYRPAAPQELFGDGEVTSFDLAELAADAGATYRRGTVAAVASQARRIRLASDAHLDYSALILAVGARARSAIPGATTFRDQRDAAAVRRALDEAWAQERRRVVFAAPPGVTWTLPLYELALLTAAEAEDRRLDAEVTVATPERAPLQIFGATASARVARLLAERDVRFAGCTHPTAAPRGALEALYEDARPADAVIAIPRLEGQRISGVPSDWSGFVLTDAVGRVEGLPDVYAAGDLTEYPVKQGGLAAQQAETVARAALATLAGAPVPEPEARELRARLVGGSKPLMLRVRLDDAGRPTDDGEVSAAPVDTAWPTEKVFRRYLAPYLAARAPRAA